MGAGAVASNVQNQHRPLLASDLIVAMSANRPFWQSNSAWRVAMALTYPSMKTAIIALAFAFSGSSIAQVAYVQYVNQRFSFTVEYPRELLIPRGESDNGDGQVFATSQGDAKLTISGGRRGKDLNFPCDALHTASNFTGTNVTYKWKKGGASVASGTTIEGKIFYVKNISSMDKCVTLIFEYPAARRATFDPLVSRISSSLRS